MQQSIEYVHFAAVSLQNDDTSAGHSAPLYSSPTGYWWQGKYCSLLRLWTRPHPMPSILFFLTTNLKAMQCQNHHPWLFSGKKKNQERLTHSTENTDKMGHIWSTAPTAGWHQAVSTTKCKKGSRGVSRLQKPLKNTYGGAVFDSGCSGGKK